MENLFLVALVGRPNAGKSSLFNALLGYPRAISSPTPHTTVDRVTEAIRGDLSGCQLVDTPGEDSADRLVAQILSGALAVSCVIFVVDGKSSPSPLDKETIRILKQKLELPLALCIQKVDREEETEEKILDFSEFRIDDVFCVSAAHRLGIERLKDWILAQYQKVRGEETFPNATSHSSRPRKFESRKNEIPTIVLLGRPNTGKSTFINRLSKIPVSKVSSEPLTTRDTIAHEIHFKNKRWRIIDTAGLRRPRTKKDDIESISGQMTRRALRQGDIIFLFIRSTEPPTDQDVRLLRLAEQCGKPILLLLNFWDLTKGSQQRKTYLGESDYFGWIDKHPSVLVSGKYGEGLVQCFQLAEKILSQKAKRISTHQMNRLLASILAKHAPPHQRSANLLYGTQVSVSPPTFVLFVNDSKDFPPTYQSYLKNELKKMLGLQGQSLKILMRSRKKSEKARRRT